MMTDSPIYDTPSHQLPPNTVITQLKCRRKTKTLTTLSILLQLLVLTALVLILYFTYKVHEHGALTAAKDVIKLKKHFNKIVGNIFDSGNFETLKRFFKGPLTNYTGSQDVEQDVEQPARRVSEEYRHSNTFEHTILTLLGQIWWTLRNSVYQRGESTTNSSLLAFPSENETTFRESTPGPRQREARTTSHDHHSRSSGSGGHSEFSRGRTTPVGGDMETRGGGTTLQWTTSPSVESNPRTYPSQDSSGSWDDLFTRSRAGRFGDSGEVPLQLTNPYHAGYLVSPGGAGSEPQTRDGRMPSGKGQRLPRSASASTIGRMHSASSARGRHDWTTEHRVRLETQLQGVNSGAHSSARNISSHNGDTRNSLESNQTRKRRDSLRSESSTVSTVQGATSTDQSGQYNRRGRNQLKQRHESYTGGKDPEYLGVEPININPEVPQDAPYTTLSQTGQVITDISLSVLYATFNTSILRTHIRKARELVGFVEGAVKALATNHNAKTPSEEAPGTQMMLDIFDAITLFEERCVRLWSISNSMAGNLETHNYKPRKRPGPRTLATQAELTYPDPEIIHQAIPEELRNQTHSYTWRQLLDRFPRPKCYDRESIEECTQEEQQRVELFQLATIYVMENDSSVLPAIQDLLTTLEVDVLTPPSTYAITTPREEERSKRGVVAIGVRLLGIVISLFSGLTYAGILGGPSTKEINQVIFDEKTPVGPVNDKSKSLDEVTDNVYRSIPEGHEQVLDRLMERASVNTERFQEAIKTHTKNKHYPNFGDYESGSKKLADSHFLNFGMSYATTIVHQIDQYLSYGHMLANSFEQALAGTVPMELFPPADVIKSLNNIESQKNDAYTLIFDDNFRDVPQFYSMKLYVTSHPDDPTTFILSVILPMTNRRETYGLYEYHDDPIFVGPENLLLRIKPETSLVMTDHHNSLIRALRPEELTQCTKVNLKYLCPDIKLFLKRETCLTGLVKNNPETVFGLCDLEFDTQRGTLVRRFGENQYVFRSNRTQTIKFTCNGVQNTHLQTITKGQSRLYIPVGCTAIVDSVYISNTGELTTGDPAVGQPYLHYPLVDNLQQMWHKLERRFEQFDFSTKQRKHIVKIVRDRAQPITIQELNQILLSRSVKTSSLPAVISSITLLTLLTLISILVYLYYYKLNHNRFRLLFEQTPVQPDDQPRSIITHTMIQAEEGAHANVRILDPPPYEAPRLEHSPISQRRLIHNRQLLRPVMESIRNFRPENLRRHQVGLQSQQTSQEMTESIGASTITIEEA